MPRYEFLCEKCKRPFELIMTISEREKGEVKCPKYKGTKVVPELGGFMVFFSRGSASSLPCLLLDHPRDSPTFRG